VLWQSDVTVAAKANIDKLQHRHGTEKYLLQVKFSGMEINVVRLSSFNKTSGCEDMLGVSYMLF